jgi:hypothetical protein
VDFVVGRVQTLIELLGQVEVQGQTLIMDVSFLRLSNGFLSAAHPHPQFRSGLCFVQLKGLPILFIRVIMVFCVLFVGLPICHLIQVQFLKVPLEVELLILDELVISISEGILIVRFIGPERYFLGDVGQEG